VSVDAHVLHDESQGTHLSPVKTEMPVGQLSLQTESDVSRS
jgi:hypothetical protein